MSDSSSTPMPAPQPEPQANSQGSQDPSSGPTWKQRLDDLEIERRLGEIADEAEKLAHKAVGAAGDFAHGKRAEIDGMLDKTAAGIDDKTKGKYAEKVARAKEQLSAGVAKLAEKRTEQ